ncbi:MAG: TRAP transporter substrate-binding protein DctP [Clostridia bacterium]|jgi:TRAP-type C4-dicarboxylate transport system substrate-binding protein|nr:TRAP transporter substrate-binding protein DctP [Clostridia bacterium]MDH7573979.1 TRAP transporter substrate-binding protein DctP [Clostridia bacterium]
MGYGRFASVGAVCLALLLLASGCKAPTTGSTGAATPSGQTETVVLKVNTFEPEDPYSGAGGKDVWKWWAEELGKRANGKVRVEIYYAEGLHKNTDSLEALDAGVSDVAFFTNPALVGRFPISSDLFTDSPLGSMIARQKGVTRKEDRYNFQLAVLDKLLAQGLLEEYKGYKVVGWKVITPNLLFTTNKKVTRLEDLKGLKLRAPGKTGFKIVQGLGGSPATVTTTEVYTALERKVVDGGVLGIAALKKFKWAEVVKYGVDYPLTRGMQTALMTERKWNSLPEDVRAAIEELKPELTARLTGREMQLETEAIEAFIQGGGELIKLSPEEEARWDKVMGTIVEQTIAELESKGLPARKVVEIAEQTAEEFRASR